MNFKDVIYAPVLTLLDDFLTLIDDVPTVIDQNVERDQVYFDLGELKEEIEISKGDENKRGIIKNLLHLVKSSPTNHILFQLDNLKLSKFEIVLTLSSLLEEDLNVILSKDLIFSLGEFKILSYNEKFPFKLFGYLNNVVNQNSLCHLDFSADWEEEISTSNINSELMALCLYLISQKDFIEKNKQYIVVRSDATNEASIKATLKLQAIIHGKTIHDEISSQLMPTTQSASSLSPLEPYQQFNETIVILSEYNSRTEILDKFLSLYQVIENFMYRIPIVDLSLNPSMFSIRQFKLLYSNVNINEVPAINSLFKEFWSLSVDGRTFRKLVIDSFTTVTNKPGFNMNEFSDLLIMLGINLKPGKTFLQELNSNEGSIKYSSLLYKLRCAIVHNGETEFHVSHFTLTPTIQMILDFVLMEQMEKLILQLISDSSSKVWYKHQSLALYQA